MLLSLLRDDERNAAMAADAQPTKKYTSPFTDGPPAAEDAPTVETCDSAAPFDYLFEADEDIGVVVRRASDGR
jgi:hypothetical protein